MAEADSRGSGQHARLEADLAACHRSDIPPLRSLVRDGRLYWVDRFDMRRRMRTR